MSSDVMIISKEDGSGYNDYSEHEDIAKLDKALFIDEASMGEAWTEFGRWFQERYCRAPGLFEQLYGLNGHDYILFTQADLDAVKTALETMEHHLVERVLDKLDPPEPEPQADDDVDPWDAFRFALAWFDRKTLAEFTADPDGAKFRAALDARWT